jgi:hypothetical protein
MKRMSKLKLFLIFSLIILAALFVLAVFKPFATGANYTEVARQSLLQTQNEWILQFDILNHEGKDVNYTIHILFSDKDNIYSEDFVVRDGGKFTYIHHINKNTIGNGRVAYKIYKEKAEQPFEQGTYYLKP